mmetsp:Transcript_13094/g.21386  ORF Transcript_13094/g.21386 Transcript_13094/m.21386 type:complete len:350 (+) Transcript_13094:432-1481(+)|eukprot:CAMPEP_0196139998 /NCGR_PEP_ID=MMETSP0910-20130528/7069_1 /TAXON_ID=49265 /ORGANISM="Thalassiosira rotula, Strain GSO102" /LENGTH=349 /DNA_ID=CAMNT_0041400797 /DNA_START=582 /DNA_END=1631 /DNA_ORIENTATION=-
MCTYYTADLLRLDWKESMGALVHDWTSPHQNNAKQRFDDFIELEHNVRTYVRKNITDLTHIEKSYVLEYKHANKGIIERSSSISLEDHIRFRYFPYEDLIVRIMNRAIGRDGEYVLSTHELNSIGGDEKKKPMAEVHGRIGLLARAGTLLDAMTSSFHDADGGGDNDNGDDTNDNEDKKLITSNNTYNNNQHLWTIHHTSCSNCYRSVLSGWFLLYRRLREANRKILADDSELDASDVLEATTKLDVHPEEEALVRAEEWIEFCCTGVDAAAGGREAEEGGTGGEGAGEKGADGLEGGKTLLLGGILPSDKPLLMGVVKILSMSENSKRRMQAIELDEKLNELFPEMNE